MRCKSYLLNELCQRIKSVTDKVQPSSEEYIVVNHISTELGYLVIQDDLMGYCLKKESGCNVASITTIPDESTRRIDRAFGIEPCDIGSINIVLIKKIIARLKSFSIFFGNKQKKLENLSYKGILIGDLVYEYIQGNKIYQGKPNMKKLSLIKDLHYIYNSLLLAERVLIWSKDKKIRYVVSQETNVFRGIPPLVLLSKGADIVVTDWFRDTISIKPDGENRNNWKKVIYLRELIKKDMAKPLSISDGNKYVFDLNLRDVSRNDVVREIGIKQDGFNVFIMLHCFDDSCRSMSARDNYYDYYDWYINTLRITSKLTGNNINWIFRNHPFAKRYHQEDFPKIDFFHYKTDNMYWMDGVLGGSDIMQAVDCVVTDIGDVGVEYVAQGIPSLYTGNPVYVGYGIGTKVNNEKDYENALKNIRSIRKPDSEEMKMAERIIHLIRNRREVCDDLISSFIGESSDNYVNSMRHRVDNNRILSEIIPLLTRESIDSSGYARKAKEIVNKG